MSKHGKLAETFGSGRIALHVSFQLKANSLPTGSKPKFGSITCVVTCGAWRDLGIPSGRIRKSTSLSIEVKDFDRNKCRAVGTSTAAIQINKELNEVLRRIGDLVDEHYLNPTKKGRSLDQKDVLAAISGRVTTTSDFLYFVSEGLSVKRSSKKRFEGVVGRYLENRSLLGGGYDFEAESSVNNYVTMAVNIAEFSRIEYNGKLTLAELTDKSIADRTARRLKTFLTSPKGRNLSDASAENVLRRMRTVLIWARNQGYGGDADLSVYRHKVRRQSKVTLTQDELKLLASLTFNNGEEHLKRARDLFLFQCVTGLRYSDVQRIGDVDPLASEFLHPTKKTGKTVRIPIFSMTRQLLRAYPQGLPRLSNQKLNENIKRVCKAAGLSRVVVSVRAQGGKEIHEKRPLHELVASHTGRRQFVTIARMNHVPDAVIREITGHENLDEIGTYFQMQWQSTKPILDPLDKAFGELASDDSQ